MGREKKNSLLTDLISTSSNLPENAYMLSLRKWMVDSCIHPMLFMLEVIKDTACLTEAEYNIDAVLMSFSTFSQSVPICSS